MLLVENIAGTEKLKKAIDIFGFVNDKGMNDDGNGDVGNSSGGKRKLDDSDDGDYDKFVDTLKQKTNKKTYKFDDTEDDEDQLFNPSNVFTPDVSTSRTKKKNKNVPLQATLSVHALDLVRAHALIQDLIQVIRV